MQTRIVRKSPHRPLLKRWEDPAGAFGGASVTLTASGRTAILGGLRALGMQPGAVVLVPAWHCGSEVDAVMAAGARPILYRLHGDMTADLDHISQLAEEHAPWAIYVTHYFGYQQPISPIREIAGHHGARLIEDMALGILSRDAYGAPLGRAGDMTIFSLVKTFAVPDGGALWLRDHTQGQGFASPGPMRNLKGLVNMVKRRKRWVGALEDHFAGASERNLDRWDDAAGIDPAAPLMAPTWVTRALLGFMDCESIAAAHRRNYEALWYAFCDHPAGRPVLPPLPAGACPAFFALRVAEPERASGALAAAGVQSVRFWRRFHDRVDLADFPDIVALKRQTLRLPVHPDIGAGAVQRMADALA